ncbi:hypothetical protein EAG_14818 [Camponotus floridanus]|uniref:Uncharacterized protein n=1 Tax=Camponotus floridanus TaxID=104421 RepID=E2ALV9_CAMFO|nr:hypothetical protein EAG_14818 [Camponotus floridanus]
MINGNFRYTGTSSQFGTKRNDVTKIRNENDTVRYDTVRNDWYGKTTVGNEPPERDKSAILGVSWRPATKREKSTQTFYSNEITVALRWYPEYYDTSCFWEESYGYLNGGLQLVGGGGGGGVLDGSSPRGPRNRLITSEGHRTVTPKEWLCEALKSRADFPRISSIFSEKGSIFSAPSKFKLLDGGLLFRRGPEPDDDGSSMAESSCQLGHDRLARPYPRPFPKMFPFPSLQPGRLPIISPSGFLAVIILKLIGINIVLTYD